MKKINKMTNKELAEEIEAIEQQINITSYGKFELIFREELYKEVQKRNLEIQRDIKIKLVKY